MHHRHLYAVPLVGAVMIGTLSACTSSVASDSVITPEPIAAEASGSVFSSSPIDVQAHSGGRGEYTEGSEAAFINALEVGVTTLEFVITLSKDGVPVVWNDAHIFAEKCSDTAPVTPGDPQFPYVGKRIDTLTYAQVRTLDCSKPLADFPEAHHPQGSTILQLKDVFNLAKGAPYVRFNIEPRTEVGSDEATALPQDYVAAILSEVESFDLSDRVAIQSSDWSVLPMVRASNREVLTVAKYDAETFTDGSPWLAGIQYSAVHGDPITAVVALGADAIAPNFGGPLGVRRGDTGARPETMAEYVDRAHEHNLLVIPWTVNDPATMVDLVNAGVDGIITDYPSRLADVLNDQRISLS